MGSSAFSVLVQAHIQHKRKDDLVILAGALGLKAAGTVSELTTFIQSKSHLSDNSAIQLKPQFAGLFLWSKQRRMDNTNSTPVDTNVYTGPFFNNESFCSPPVSPVGQKIVLVRSVLENRPNLIVTWWYAYIRYTTSGYPVAAY
jgi:hypothetical protein